MKWVTFLVKAVVIFLVIWGILIYGYGELFLSDSVVPEQGVAIQEWLNYYYFAGIISVIIGLFCSCIWFWFGINFSGGMGISAKYMILFVVAIILSIISAFVIILPATDGKGLSFIFASIVAPIGFYLVSLFDTAEAVKFIPPLGETVHK
jgi:hypothetical protein